MESNGLGYTPNEIAIKSRDNDQQNHWVNGVHYFQTNPSDQIESKSNQYQYLYLNLYLSISLLIVYEPVNLLEGSTMFEFLTSG